MRRLVLALLLLPSLAEARGLVIINRVRNSAFSAAVTFRQEKQADYAEMLTRQLLDRFEVAYDIVPAGSVVTEDCRTGQYVKNRGTSSAAVTSYAWVLHVAYPGKLCKSARWPFPNYRPDSLHISALGGCTVPQVFWNMQTNGALPSSFLADTCDAGGNCDTTGFETGTSALNGVGGCQFQTYVASHSGYKFLESSYISTPAPGTPSTPSGGLRLLVGRRAGDPAANLTGMEVAWQSDAARTVGWADSNVAFSTDRTTPNWEVWEMPFAHISGAKPLIFAQCWGISGCTDSTGTSTATPCEWDTQNALWSLARADSLTNHGVFGRVLGLGVVVRGGFERSNVGNPGGISPADTTALKFTLDSLATLGSRFRCLVTANMDSVGAFTSEKGWWSRLPAMRYTPVANIATKNDTAGSGNTKWTRPIDVWGTKRKRAAMGTYQDSAYVYDPDGFAADTSMYVLIRSLLFHADSTFGRDYVSRFLVPPGDDWFPLANTAGFPVDSVFTAARRAGAVGLLFNSQRRTTPAEARGAWAIGEERILRTLDGKPFLLLGHSGIACNGGRFVFDVRADSANWQAAVCQLNGFNKPQYSFPSMPAYEVHRAINQLVFTRYRDPDYMMRARYTDPFDDVNTPTDDAIYALRRGSVWVTSANELGGGGMLAAGYPPTRPAWWTIKSLDQFMLGLNAQAGRTVIKWEYPEMIRP